MGEEPIIKKSPAMLPVRYIAVPSPSGIDILYELWTERDKPNLWRMIMIHNDDSHLRAHIAAQLIAAHIVRGQQADPVERVAQSLTEADMLIKLLQSEEVAQEEAQVAAHLDLSEKGVNFKGNNTAAADQPGASKVGSGG